MSPYKSFAIVGFGQVGSLYAQQFVEHQADGYKWKILTRNADKPEFKDLVAKGGTISLVDYTSQDSLREALSDVDVVISALRDDGLEVQLDVVRAAKSAGVSLFVPSEYGRNTLGFKEPYLKFKSDTHELLKELELPYTLFFTGIWPEMFRIPGFGDHVGMNFKEGKFFLFGDGNTKSSWTSPHSFIPFAFRLLTSLPPSKLENKVFEIEGDSKSFREVIQLWEKKTGKTAEIYERSEEEIQAFINTQQELLFQFLPRQWQNGGMKVSGKDNKLWSEWKPLTMDDFVITF